MRSVVRASQKAGAGQAHSGFRGSQDGYRKPSQPGAGTWAPGKLSACQPDSGRPSPAGSRETSAARRRMKNITERSGAALKTYLVLLFFLALKAAGNSAMAWGMKQVPERMSMNPALYLRAMLTPLVAVGVVAPALALLTRMAWFSLAN